MPDPAFTRSAKLRAARAASSRVCWFIRAVERVEGFADRAEWDRAYKEINAFEVEQVTQDATILKLFVHITQETQDRELLERVETPHKRWKFAADDLRNCGRRPAYLEAMADMFARTDTGHAPWVAMDGNNRKATRIAALSAIANRLEAHVDMMIPELDPALEAEVRSALSRAERRETSGA